uniref:Uncharacterized shell protein 4 n=1 Tax=Pinctada maxima TaxID=104660 RepID=UP4_PINMA|nr:RecName: Full=Uncharacterized shell protein 4; AltName: Full=Nacre uncharacterized shell protein 6; Short=NUSP6; Flags: Precursor [Pinctada maxima]
MKYVALAFVLSLVILQISAQGGGLTSLLLQKEYMPDSWFDYKLAQMILGGPTGRKSRTQSGRNQRKSNSDSWLWLALAN